MALPGMTSPRPQGVPLTEPMKPTRAGQTAKHWQIMLMLAALGLSLAGCQQEATSQREQSKNQALTANGNTSPKVPETGPKITAQPHAEQSTLIIPGQRVGEITARSTLSDLQRMFGAENVKPGAMPGPEGTTLPGAVLFPTDARQKLTLYWKESGPGASKTSPEHSKAVNPSNNPTVATIIIDEPHSPFHTEDGIQIGTTLKELEKLNGQPFTLSGFDWDYGGMVLSWGDKGKLREKLQKNGGLSLQLYPPENTLKNNPTDASKVSGDGSFSSANPAMQKLNPQVTTMSVYLQ
jgi:hypothetical protein